MFRFCILIIIFFFLFPSSVLADTAILYPIMDAYTWELYPNYEYGNTSACFVGRYLSSGLRCYIGFDITNFYGATINLAVLDVYVYAHEGTWPNNEIMIGRVTESWDEDTINWNNQPNWTDETGAGTSTDGWWDIGITNYMQGWVDSSYYNYGLVLFSNTAYENSLGYYSRENGYLIPQMELDYEYNSIKSASIGEIKAAFK